MMEGLLSNFKVIFLGFLGVSLTLHTSSHFRKVARARDSSTNEYRNGHRLLSMLIIVAPVLAGRADAAPRDSVQSQNPV